MIGNNFVFSPKVNGFAVRGAVVVNNEEKKRRFYEKKRRTVRDFGGSAGPERPTKRKKKQLFWLWNFSPRTAEVVINTRVSKFYKKKKKRKNRREAKQISEYFLRVECWYIHDWSISDTFRQYPSNATDTPSTDYYNLCTTTAGYDSSVGWKKKKIVFL